MDQSTKMFLAGLAVGVLLVVAWYYFKGSNSKETYPGTEEKKIVSKPEPKKAQLAFFYSNGCHHCHAMMPTWTKLEEILSQGGPVEPIKIEMGEPASQGHDIKGVPTLRLYIKGMDSPEFIEYKGDRSLEDIVRFISQPKA